MDGNDEERAATPPPEERDFVDDDGTAYRWDPAQRRFAELGAPPAPSYGVEEMTFAVEPEVIPAMPRKEARPPTARPPAAPLHSHDKALPLSLGYRAVRSSDGPVSCCAHERVC